MITRSRAILIAKKIKQSPCLERWVAGLRAKYKDNFSGWAFGSKNVNIYLIS